MPSSCAFIRENGARADHQRRNGHTTFYSAALLSTANSTNDYRAQLVVADCSLLAENTVLLAVCHKYSSVAIKSCLLQRRSLKRNIAVFKIVKFKFAIMICAVQHKKEKAALKPVPYVCVSTSVPATEQNWSYKMAATTACLCESAQLTRSVLLSANRRKAVRLTSHVFSKLIAVQKSFEAQLDAT